MGVVITKRMITQGTDLSGKLKKELGVAVVNVTKVARDDARQQVRTKKVQSVQLHYRTGQLSQGYKVAGPKFTARSAYAELYNNVKHARFVEEGTGIYGPRGQRIRPRRPNGVLAWPAGGNIRLASGAAIRRRGAFKRGVIKVTRKNANMIFARSVRGIPAFHIVRDAMRSSAVERATVAERQAALARAFK